MPQLHRKLLPAVVLAASLTAACYPGYATTTSTSDPAAVATSPSTSPAAATALLATLRVAVEDTGAHYHREDWKHWIAQPAAGRGCDTRELVLNTQGQHDGGGPVAHDPVTCAPFSGHGNRWTSPYDGVTVTDPARLDIDHLVPLGEAARSGTRAWTSAQRERFANDTALLIAVTAKTNRAKGDQDPARWLPALDRCGYASHWIEVKHRYAMSVDPAEHDALAGLLRRC
ncbi:HNH endonuclease family protein [Amycolatopsis eburnea]|uniref:HNH endonuclease n=1 Tax=Amycolatopsis eburnea TaxID=2267691 RepID=A0A427TPW6_9PSEU|nr:HNH endonuclease family protein [Amycolatopsis eburnea]RSD26430.1 HNH endonuclease [Amycolatopsis eburnea]